MATIMGAHGQSVTLKLDSPQSLNQAAAITIRAEEASNTSDLVVFKLKALRCTGNEKRFVFLRI